MVKRKTVDEPERAKKAEKAELQRIMGGNVRRLREARGLSRERLAEMVERDTSTINRIENGTTMMGAPLIARMARVLGVSVDTLFSADPDDLRLKNIQAPLVQQPDQDVSRIERMIRAYFQTQDPDV